MRAPRRLRQALSRAHYRGAQFFRGFRARLSPAEIEVVRALLNPRELRLFLALEPRDRRHSYQVLRWLEVTSGPTPPSEVLRKAALLHDVGKGQLWVWDRVAYVLLEAVSPRLVDLLAAQADARWRRALWQLRHHADLGARVLAEAGSEPRVVALVRAHTDRAAAADPDLARLIEADRAS